MASGGAHNPAAAGSIPALSTTCPIAQQAERRSYKAAVGGSKPSRATIFTAVAQWNRARLCEGRGRVFESPQPYHPIGARPIGRTRDFESRNRGSNPRRRASPRVGRLTVRQRTPNPPIGVRIVAGLPKHLHAVAERLGARLQPSRSRFNSGRRVHFAPVAQR